MVALAKKRLVRFGAQAEVYLTDGSPHLDFGTATFDRFVSNNVLDLLTFDDIRTILQEAWRVLTEGGLLGLTSLTHGFTPISRLVTSIWMKIHAFRPMLVGGCRPINLLELVSEPRWRLDFFIGSLFEKTSASSDPDSWNAKLLWNKGPSWLKPWFN
jgi:SAM-dependent methyltransferase